MAYLMAIGWRTPHVVTISDDSGPVSGRDFREFYAILSVIAEEAAPQGQRFGVPTWEEFYKGLFIGQQEIPAVGGGTVMRAISKTVLSRREFAAFLLQVRSHAASELGVVFPLWE